MNGNFRNPKFVKRYEYTYYDLETPLNANVGNNARQEKTNYQFEVDNSSEANQLVALADGATKWSNIYQRITSSM